LRPTFFSAIFGLGGFNNLSKSVMSSGLSRSNPIVNHGDVVEFVDFSGRGSNLFLLKRKIGKTRFICQESWLFRP